MKKKKQERADDILQMIRSRQKESDATPKVETVEPHLTKEQRITNKQSLKNFTNFELMQNLYMLSYGGDRFEGKRQDNWRMVYYELFDRVAYPRELVKATASKIAELQKHYMETNARDLRVEKMTDGLKGVEPKPTVEPITEAQAWQYAFDQVWMNGSDDDITSEIEQDCIRAMKGRH